jgi:hypothetical protein
MTNPADGKAQVFAEAFRAEADAIERDPGAPGKGATALREVAETVKAIPAWVEDDDIRGWAKTTAKMLRALGPGSPRPDSRESSASADSSARGTHHIPQ